MFIIYCFYRNIKEWFFMEQVVIESAINKLKSSLDSAYLHRHTFVSATYQAVSQFQQVILFDKMIL